MPLRRARAGSALLPVVVLLTALVAGCGSDGGSEPSDDTSHPASGSPTATDPGGATEQPETDESDDPGSTATGLPPEVAGVCAPYLTMVEALQGVDYEAEAHEVAAELGPVVKEWAAAVAELERPAVISDQAWDGMLLLADRITALPDDPTLDDIEDVEKRFTDAQQAKVEAAGHWLGRTCA